MTNEARLAPPPRELLATLAEPGLHVIAEVKRRSPSAGRIVGGAAATSAAAAAAGDVPATDVAAIARAYEAGGAAAISVLCEPHWFGGSIDDLRAVRAAVRLPILAKEFVVDARQLAILRSAGADLVLLLVALHPQRRLEALVREIQALGMEPLVEAHDERELERAIATDARLIGINNRDLRTLAIDSERCERLRALVPEDRLVVAESGVRDPATLIRWRAVGFDAALIGESLMRAADPRAAVAAFAAAGRVPRDIAAADRAPMVKTCGIVDEAGVRAAIHADADAIGLNLVPGTPRALEPAEAAALASYARSIGHPGRPRIVTVTVDRTPADLARLVGVIDPDVLQLSGQETPDSMAGLPRPAWKVLHVQPEGSDGEAVRLIEQAQAYLATGRCELVMLDTAGGIHPGGTGRRSDVGIAAAVAREVPVILAGGLRPGNVALALREVPAVGVDVASGVERDASASDADPRPRKDPLAVALFVKRARAARFDQPHVPSRPTPIEAGLLAADERGRWGAARDLGGRYVPETLVPALLELERTYAQVRHDPIFWAGLRDRLAAYAGRPTPLYRADRLAAEVVDRAGSLAGPDRRLPALRLYLKREDLAHTGAHKITNALGQALLARRLGKDRVIAETGAGQHGVATATACALLGLPCVVYMGAIDIARQRPNVLRMEALGAEVRPVHSGSATLKDAINDAMRDWVTNVATTHYVLGSAMGPHPYPTIVRDLQRVIGDEAAVQVLGVEGRLPDVVVACVGGGSNAIGLFSRFIGEVGVRLVAVEAAGEGIATGRHAAAIAGGSVGVIHGARTMMLQDVDGQVVEAHSLSAGLDYPGVGPQLAALAAAGRMDVRASTDSEALEQMRVLARTEGILPALESAHALAALPGLVAEAARAATSELVVLVGLSGRGDKDLGHLEGGEVLQA